MDIKNQIGGVKNCIYKNIYKSYIFIITSPRSVLNVS